MNRVATTSPSVAAMHSMTPIIQEITRRATIVRQAIILADILAHGTTASTTTLSTMHFSTTSKTLSDIIFRFVVPFCRFFDLKGEPRHGSCCLKFLKTLIIIPKSPHIERMHQNLDILDFSLSDKDMEEILPDRAKTKTLEIK